MSSTALTVEEQIAQYNASAEPIVQRFSPQLRLLELTPQVCFCMPAR
jgi:hypothetical protein